MLLMVDPRDLGLVTQVRSPHSEAPTIYLYEAVPGGIGLSERLFKRHDELVAGRADLIAACGCEGGCPACTGPRLEPDVDGKALALRLLARADARRRSAAERGGGEPRTASRTRRPAEPAIGRARAIDRRRLLGATAVGLGAAAPTSSADRRTAASPAASSTSARNDWRWRSAASWCATRSGRRRRRVAGDAAPGRPRAAGHAARPAAGGRSAALPRHGDDRACDRRRARSPSSSGSAGGRAAGSVRSSSSCRTTPTNRRCSPSSPSRDPARTAGWSRTTAAASTGRCSSRATGWPPRTRRSTPDTWTCCRSSAASSGTACPTPACASVESELLGHRAATATSPGWEIPGAVPRLPALRRAGSARRRGPPQRRGRALARRASSSTSTAATPMTTRWTEAPAGDLAGLARAFASDRPARRCPALPRRRAGRGPSRPTAAPPVATTRSRHRSESGSRRANRAPTTTRGGRHAGRPDFGGRPGRVRARSRAWDAAESSRRDAPWTEIADARRSGPPAPATRPVRESEAAWVALAAGRGTDRYARLDRGREAARAPARRPGWSRRGGRRPRCGSRSVRPGSVARWRGSRRRSGAGSRGSAPASCAPARRRDPARRRGPAPRRTSEAAAAAKSRVVPPTATTIAGVEHRREHRGEEDVAGAGRVDHRAPTRSPRSVRRRDGRRPSG